MPLELRGVESVWYLVQVKLYYIGFKVPSMNQKGNKSEEKGGKQDLGFGFHFLCCVFCCLFFVRDWGVFELG